jgi:hypothetical protein
MASVNKEKYEYGIDKDIKKRLDAKMDPNRLAEVRAEVSRRVRPPRDLSLSPPSLSRTPAR